MHQHAMHVEHDIVMANLSNISKQMQLFPPSGRGMTRIFSEIVMHDAFNVIL